jgi:hypothetical protein
VDDEVKQVLFGAGSSFLKPAALVVVKRLFQFGVGIHHEWAASGDRFVERFTGNQ